MTEGIKNNKALPHASSSTSRSTLFFANLSSRALPIAPFPKRWALMMNLQRPVLGNRFLQLQCLAFIPGCGKGGFVQLGTY